MLDKFSNLLFFVHALDAAHLVRFPERIFAAQFWTGLES